MDFLFGPKTLKQEIIQRLKPFSQLKQTYHLQGSLYRTGAIDYFSEKAKKYNLAGVPINRITTRPLDDEEPAHEDILEPIWFSSRIKDSIGYCNREREEYEKKKKMYERMKIDVSDLKVPPMCETYEYIPYDVSIGEKKQKLLFLDLNSGETWPQKDEEGKEFTMYHLDQPFMQKIYGAILEKYKESIIDNGDGEGKYMCVDNPCENTFTINEIIAAYGFYGFRSSEQYIDRFVTLELFHLMKELNIEKELNCVIMGYFHGDVFSGEYNDDPAKVELGGFLPAEFAIPYKGVVNKHYMKYIGPVGKPGALVPVPLPVETRKRVRSSEEEFDAGVKRQKPTSSGGGTKKLKGSLRNYRKGRRKDRKTKSRGCTKKKIRI